MDRILPSNLNISKIWQTNIFETQHNSSWYVFRNTPPRFLELITKQGKKSHSSNLSNLENVSSYFNKIKFELHNHVGLWHEDWIPKDSKSKDDFAKIVLGESEPIRINEPFAI